MASVATSETHSQRVLVDGQPTPVEIESHVAADGQRLEVSASGDQWVYIVDVEHVAHFETATTERRCPDWLDQLLRSLGALDVEVAGGA